MYSFGTPISVKPSDVIRSALLPNAVSLVSNLRPHPRLAFDVVWLHIFNLVRDVICSAGFLFIVPFTIFYVFSWHSLSFVNYKMLPYKYFNFVICSSIFPSITIWSLLICHWHTFPLILFWCSLTHGAEPFSRSCQLCSYSRTSQHFMEPEGSIPCSQQPSTGPYPQPDQSNPYHSILSL
jgi:hypothetical protein